MLLAPPTRRHRPAARRSARAATGAALLALLLLAGSARAASVEMAWAVASDYVWRGAVQTLDRGQPSLQLSATVAGDLGPGSLSFNAWVAETLRERGANHRALGNAIELDCTLDYSLDLVPEALGLSFGAMAYLYPEAGAGGVDPALEAQLWGAEEAYVGGWASTAAADLGATLYLDPRGGQGAYLELSASRSLELVAETLSLEPALVLGGGYYAQGEGDAVLNDLTVKLQGEWAAGKGTKLGLLLAWSLGDPLGADGASFADRQIPWGLLTLTFGG